MQRSSMMLLDGNLALVDRAKIVDYLLSTSHADGRGRAAFFVKFGFSAERWKVLAAALKEVGVSNSVTSTMESSHGTRYTVDGPLRVPDGRTPVVRTVWIVEAGHPPRLITAYPR